MLKKLDAGLMVMGSKADGRVKNMADMSLSSQRRLGYTDKNGNWTDRGFDRATSADYDMLEKSRKAAIRNKKV
jgi:hypothetical protein